MSNPSPSLDRARVRLQQHLVPGCAPWDRTQHTRSSPSLESDHGRHHVRSRLSRSVADTASIQRDLGYYDIKLLTIADNGEADPIVLAVKGGINEQYLVDLRQSVRRGQVGRIKAGKSAGGLAYGYRITTVGERDIVPEQAEIVRRIFAEYLLGRSGLDIATTLNSEGIKGPRGNSWGSSAIMGNHRRGTGILNNALYVGQNRYGKLEYRKNPATGKRQSRIQTADKVIPQDVPQLRIIDDETWKIRAAHTRSS